MANNKNVKTKTKTIKKPTGTTTVQKTVASSNNPVEHNEETLHHRRKGMYTENWWLWLIISILGALAVGGLARLLGGNMNNFNAHILPPGTVPRWVFGLAWPILYTFLGISAFLVFFKRTQDARTLRADIIWFSINLFLNMIWPLLFYRFDLLIVSCVLIGLIVITAIITNYRFYYRNLAAGILYSIYTAWLCYALYLNLAIALLNT